MVCWNGHLERPAAFQSKQPLANQPGAYSNSGLAYQKGLRAFFVSSLTCFAKTVEPPPPNKFQRWRRQDLEAMNIFIGLILSLSLVKKYVMLAIESCPGF